MKQVKYATRTVEYSPTDGKAKGARYQIHNWPAKEAWLGMMGDQELANAIEYAALQHVQVRMFNNLRAAEVMEGEFDFATWVPKSAESPEQKAAKRMAKQTDEELIAGLMVLKFSRAEAEEKVKAMRACEVAKAIPMPKKK